MAAASIRRFRVDAHVEIIPAPVWATFYHPRGQKVVRRSLGIPDEDRCVLVMSGGWGIGPIDDIARTLGAAGLRVLAVVGESQPLTRCLRRAARANPLIMSFGYTDRVAELMTASDVVVTSAGDTCHEARVIGRPIVL
jgi:processive 1,2-diacylglycerol beta-glucosyltransferase